MKHPVTQKAERERERERARERERKKVRSLRGKGCRTGGKSSNVSFFIVVLFM